MLTRKLPFTWPELERATGRPVPEETRERIRRHIRRPTAETWEAARSIVVAPQMSAMGQTLWQCVQAITLELWPDGDVPDARVTILALCYAAGLPWW